jgi:hypothetical protein
VARLFKTPIAPPALSSDPTGTTAGEIYYNTSSGVLKYYNGTTWQTVGTGAGVAELQQVYKHLLQLQILPHKEQFILIQQNKQ